MKRSFDFLIHIENLFQLSFQKMFIQEFEIFKKKLFFACRNQMFIDQSFSKFLLIVS